MSSSADHFLEVELLKAREHQQKLENLKKLAADPEMFRLMKQLVAKVNGAARGEAASSSKGSAIELHAIKSTPNGLTQEVIKGINKLSGRQFTVNDIKTHLDGISFQIQAKEPRTAIGSVMDRLRKRGLVKLLKKGTGGQPHVYVGS